MLDLQNPALRGVSDVHASILEELRGRFRLYTTLRILVVVDGSISLTEGPGAFGVGRVMRLMREASIGCTRFTVDTARRNGSTAGSPTYLNFRFDLQEAGAPVINKYHQIWCFGFNPDNNAETDANITAPGALPMGDAELTALTRWMNEQRGGLLAMGDHDYLGASMCHRIPRIRSMRRWTNAQGVPPIGGAFDADTHLRHDTNQPATAAQISAGALIPFSNQEDAVPQRISWAPWMSHSAGLFQVHRRPHPILCHPQLGPIDVMPDHPHEGWCYETNEIDLGAPLNVPGLAGSEYPTVAGFQPRPMVIAHGTTTPNPPFNLAKGPSPQKRFGLVSAYDGHVANVGRVVTDSTWHHWFDENLFGIEQAGGDNWAKISRYFLNVGLWLAPPSSRSICIVAESLTSHLSYAGFQEYRRNAHLLDLGQAFHAHLHAHYGPCWVTHWVLDHIRLVDADVWAWLRDRLFWRDGIPAPVDGPCLSCPSFDWLERAVLGAVVRAGFDIADDLRSRAHKDGKLPATLRAERLEKELLANTAEATKALREQLSQEFKGFQALLR